MENVKTGGVSIYAISTGVLADVSTIAGQLAVIVGLILACWRLYVEIDKWRKWRRENK